jgi:hypothetical protein
MREIYSGEWGFMAAMLLFVVFLTRMILQMKTGEKKRTHRLPPGRRGWPVVGDSISWYHAVASSHPPSFVEEQVKRFGKIFSCSLFGKRSVVSADPSFNRFVMQNEGKLFRSCYPKSFRDLVGKNGVITVQGEQQRKLHAIASNMMRLDKLKFHFLKDIQIVMLQTFRKSDENQVVSLQDVCRKASDFCMMHVNYINGYINYIIFIYIISWLYIYIYIYIYIYRWLSI